MANGKSIIQREYFWFLVQYKDNPGFWYRARRAKDMTGKWIYFHFVSKGANEMMVPKTSKKLHEIVIMGHDEFELAERFDIRRTAFGPHDQETILNKKLQRLGLRTRALHTSGGKHYFSGM